LTSMILVSDWKWRC